MDCNLYFAVNPSREPADRKAEKTDIAVMEYLHVDVDPRAGENIPAEQARIFETFRRFRPKPTCVIFSGGGYQAFWKLMTPLALPGTVETADAAAGYNRQLEFDLGGDNCHNLDRIMRLPGTVNHPNERKRKKGRTECPTSLIYFDPTVAYDLSAFRCAPAQVAALPTTQPPGTVAAPAPSSASIQRIDDINTLKLPPWLKVLIVQGRDPDNPTRWPSRSEALFSAVCGMVRGGMDDTTICSVITDPGFGISASVLDKGRGTERYAMHQIGRARVVASIPELSELNAKHCVIESLGSKCRVLCEIWDPAMQRAAIEHQSFHDFMDRYCNRFMTVGVEKPKQVPLGKWWLGHPARRQKEFLAFLPGQEAPENTYNMWKGFAFAPKEGNCDLYLKHIHDNICAGVEPHYAYLLGWMAMMIQRPAQVGSVAIVLRGTEGVGKGFFAHNLGKLLGRHYMSVCDSTHLVGHFNSHLQDCLLLFADEAFFAGDPRHERVLKSLVTEPYLTIEGKYLNAVPAPNYLHIIMASNNEWVVPAGKDARRFFVVDVNREHQRDRAYFSAVAEQLKQGGYEALLHYLSTYNIDNFDATNVPMTSALDDQKELSLSPEEAWWYDKLQEGRLLPFHDAWVAEVINHELLADYRMFLRNGGWPMGRSTLQRITKFLRRACPVGWPKSAYSSGPQTYEGVITTSARPRSYVFPPLDKCRQRWDELMGFKTTWQEVSDGSIQQPF
jgi:hypothetical protein